MKNILWLSLVIVLTLTLILGAFSCAKPAAPGTTATKTVTTTATAQAKTWELKYMSGYPAPPYLDSATADKWMNLVTERTKGRVKWTAYWGGSLGSAAETLEMVQGGVADAGNVAYGAYPDDFPIFGFDYTFLFGPSDPEIILKAMNAVWNEFPQFEQDCAKQNLKHLFLLPWDNYDLGSIEPIETLADLKGKRVGCWGVFAPKWVEAAGASGVATPAPDRYTQLMTGLLDASLLPVDVHLSLKLHEVAKYWTIANIGSFVPEPNNMNLDTWNELPADIQKIMLDTGEEVSIEHTTILKVGRQDTFNQMEDLGVTFYTLSDADRTEWASQMPDVPAEWAEEVTAKGYPGWEILQRYQELATQGGHKWVREWGVKK